MTQSATWLPAKQIFPAVSFEGSSPILWQHQLQNQLANKEFNFAKSNSSSKVVTNTT